MNEKQYLKSNSTLLKTLSQRLKSRWVRLVEGLPIWSSESPPGLTKFWCSWMSDEILMQIWSFKKYCGCIPSKIKLMRRR